MSQFENGLKACERAVCARARTASDKWYESATYPVPWIVRRVCALYDDDDDDNDDERERDTET